MAAKDAGNWQIEPACDSFHRGHRSASTAQDSPAISSKLLGRRRLPQGCIKLLDFSLSSTGWRRGWGEEVRFYWFPLSSVLSPLVPRGERTESLMQPWVPH